MPRKPTPNFNEKDLSKGQLRKLTALRKSLGDAIADQAFGAWLASAQPTSNSGADSAASMIAEELSRLAADSALTIPRGGYILRRGRGRVIVERGSAADDE